MQLRATHIIALLIFAIGVVIGWFLRPAGETIIKPIIKDNFTQYSVDTVYTIDTIRFETIRYASVKPTRIIDTIYIDTVDRSYVNDLVAQYDCLTKQLIENGYERIKYYNEITENGDSVYIELASVKDLILKLELNLASREVVNRSLNAYYMPKQEKEAWYIKPAIGLSGAALGYIIRGNVK